VVSGVSVKPEGGVAQVLRCSSACLGVDLFRALAFKFGRYIEVDDNY
jgi:hypothetical protein